MILPQFARPIGALILAAMAGFTYGRISSEERALKAKIEVLEDERDRQIDDINARAGRLAEEQRWRRALETERAMLHEELRKALAAARPVTSGACRLSVAERDSLRAPLAAANRLAGAGDVRSGDRPSPE